MTGNLQNRKRILPSVGRGRTLLQPRGSQRRRVPCGGRSLVGQRYAERLPRLRFPPSCQPLGQRPNPRRRRCPMNTSTSSLRQMVNSNCRRRAAHSLPIRIHRRRD